MAIWEFTEQSDGDIDAIISHCESLIDLGIEQDDDMMAELYAERDGRNDTG